MSSTGSRILLIEDNAANADLISYLLSAFGHIPAVATTGEQGLALMRTARPDLVLCDVHLPGIDGYAVVREIKAVADWRGIPVLAVTALAMVGDRERVLAAGFDGYVAKPIDPETFIDEISPYLQVHSRASRDVVTGAGAPPANAEPGPGGAPARGTILAVDDRAVNLSLLRSILEPVGYAVITAATIDEALQAARQRVPDVVVSDMHLVRADAFDLLAALRNEPALARVPFIVITSSGSSEAARLRGLSRGAARYLFRPIEPAMLVAELETCLRESRES